MTDSLYSVLLDALLDSNKVDLLARHLPYYDTLKGDRKAALALLAQGRGWVTNFRGQYDSSLASFFRAARLYEGLKDTYGLARSYFGIGINKMYQADYREAFRYDLKALRLFEATGDSANLYEVKLELANGLCLQSEPGQAWPILQSCLAYFTRREQWDAVAYCRSMFTKAYRDDPQQALPHCEAALKIYERLNDTAGISASLNNIAATRLALKQWEKAYEGFERSLVLVRRQKDKRQELIVWQNMAHCLIRMGRYREAEQLLRQLIDTATRSGQNYTLTNAYRLLAETRNYLGDCTGALTYYIQYKLYSDSLFNEEKARATHELLIRYETARKEAQITQLLQENKLSRTRKWLYLSVLLLTLLSSAIVVIVLRHKNKTGKLQLARASQELESNAQALAGFTDRIIRKNSQIEALEEQLRANRQITEQTEQEALHSEHLSQLYQLKILTEEDWQNFKILFDKVYPGFINKLRIQFPGIAASEERQSLLIKLNINNKESAAMLGISVEGVKKSRYRLKKRFLLSEEANLDDFVRGM